MRNALALLLIAAAAGCAGQNLTPAEPQPSPSPTPIVPACVPNLDGVIEAAEMQPALGIPAHFDVTPGSHAVSFAGVQSSGGATQWNWDWSAAGDVGFDLVGSALTGKWYASSFPDGQFTAPIDVADTTEGVYKTDSQAVWLLGVASTVENPSSGKTLLVYQQPLALYRFPLQVGAHWTSVGTITNGTLFGAPYAGYDTYDVSVDAEGSLVLPDMTFTQTLRVRTDVSVQPAVGIVSTRKLVGYFFECFGEVARATSQLDEPNADFTTASEVRRLGLPPQGGHL